MSVPTSPSADAAGQTPTRGEALLEPDDPRLAYRAALARYHSTLLGRIAQRIGLESTAARSSTLAAEITDHFDPPAVLSGFLADLGESARQALGLFALTESLSWLVSGFSHTLACLGVEPEPTMRDLLETGVLALDAAPDQAAIEDLARRLEQGPALSLRLRPHPSVLLGARVSRPAGTLEPCADPVAQVRETDGLEATLRLGALWQRLRAEPLRQTQQGGLYKRDQERIAEDPVLDGPVADGLEPLPAMPAFWLSLARRVGLIRSSGGERLEAAPTEFWTDNAVHLPQMIATSWLGLRDWTEWEPGAAEAADGASALPYLRPALLLWLASLEPSAWTALDDLAAHLSGLYPEWDRVTLASPADASAADSRRAAAARTRAASPPPRAARGRKVLGSVLLGAGYTLGLVRAAEERPSGRTVVQLTPMGRYVLALGPPPEPRPSFEHFLFVQPNFEIIAYRQGLTPLLIGLLSRFAWWSKIGAALELKLTQESVVLGLDAGLAPGRMVEILAQHSQRPLPASVPDAIRRWAGRREQITVYGAATLIEFGSRDERDQARVSWEADDSGNFLPVGDCFLLVENPQRIPTDRIRTSGARDYRHPPEQCVAIEPDGVTLVLDTIRSDLLIDAELSRIADEIPATRPDPRDGRANRSSRRYAVSAASLARAFALGVSVAQIQDWFQQRTGGPPSPAIKLLLRPASARPMSLRARRTLVLTTPSAEIADGLLQHPTTRDLLSDRLGPTALEVPEESLPALRSALQNLGLGLTLS